MRNGVSTLARIPRSKLVMSRTMLVSGPNPFAWAGGSSMVSKARN